MLERWRRTDEEPPARLFMAFGLRHVVVTVTFDGRGRGSSGLFSLHGRRCSYMRTKFVIGTRKLLWPCGSCQQTSTTGTGCDVRQPAADRGLSAGLTADKASPNMRSYI
jgi:hypothetical protein